jgi:hypothetical protein
MTFLLEFNSILKFLHKNPVFLFLTVFSITLVINLIGYNLLIKRKK